MTPETQTVGAARIVCVVSQLRPIKIAEFIVHQPEMDAQTWHACTAAAWTDWHAAPRSCVNTPHAQSMNPAQASALATALQMAVEWVAGEVGS